MLDLDKYTLGELAKIEELTGLSIPDLMKAGAPKMKRAAAICFIEKKRRGETIAWAQVLNWTMPEVNGFLTEVGAEDVDEDESVDEDAPDPKANSGKGKPKTSRSSSSRSASNPASTGA